MFFLYFNFRLNSFCTRMGFPWLLGLYVVSRVLSFVREVVSTTLHIIEFVAMPLGKGYTVEGQVTGEEVCLFPHLSSARPYLFIRRRLGEFRSMYFRLMILMSRLHIKIVLSICSKHHFNWDSSQERQYR
jgi:hypothetical protein